MRTEQRYRAPSRLARLGGRLMINLAQLGIGVYGARVLEVRGRTSGEPRRTVVNPLRHEGTEYLVAPRGVTQWVRNLRAAGTGELRLGRRRRAFQASELEDHEERIRVLRAYLRRWRFEVGTFFPGLSADAPEEQWWEVASAYPVFRLEPRVDPL